MVLAAGKVHIEAMPEEWMLNGHGMAAFVKRLPTILRTMLGPDARLPRTVFTDRGTGLYNPQGIVVKAYADAIKESGFKTFWGDDASQQSPDMG